MHPPPPPHSSPSPITFLLKLFLVHGGVLFYWNNMSTLTCLSMFKLGSYHSLHWCENNADDRGHVQYKTQQSLLEDRRIFDVPQEHNGSLLIRPKQDYISKNKLLNRHNSLGSPGVITVSSFARYRDCSSDVNPSFIPLCSALCFVWFPKCICIPHRDIDPVLG